MATNLVSLIMQLLTPDVIGRTANALGLDRSNAQDAIGAAVPGLLAGLANAVTTQPHGAQKLADAVKQETSPLPAIAGIFDSNGAQGTLVDKGSNMLSTLLGGHAQSALASAVGKFAGLDQSKSSSLLGMLTPLVVGVIAQQQGGRSISASSVANLLADQKDSIAAALPGGFGKLLAGTGLLNSLRGAAHTTTAREAAENTASAAYAAAGTGRRAAGSATSSSVNWLYWAIPILVIAGALLWLINRPADESVRQAATTGTPTTATTGLASATTNLATTAGGVMVGGVDIAKQLSGEITNLRYTLTGITDAASARAALPKLQQVTAQVDKISGSLEIVPADQRKLLAGIIRPVTPSINQLFDKVLAIPGVGEVLKPTLDSLKTKFTQLIA
jgi:Bacterial protein of unknown function (DUF937)